MDKIFKMQLKVLTAVHEIMKSQANIKFSKTCKTKIVFSACIW